MTTDNLTTNAQPELFNLPDAKPLLAVRASPLLEVQKLNNKKMEHFFYEDTFCYDLEDLANVFDIDEDNVNELKDDWQVRVESSDLEPIFKVDADSLCQLLADNNEDRLSEDLDEEAKVLKALKETIDFEKLKEALPKLYYPNNNFEIITKADLVEWFS